MPMIAWERSSPKLSGVSWSRAGYTGAHPTPTITSPTPVITWPRGSVKRTMPATAWPSRTIFLSLSFIVINPQTNRPAVMPR